MYNNIFLCFKQSEVNICVILEYIQSFGIKFGMKVVEFNNIKCYNSNDLYIFVQKIPELLLDRPMENMILLNIEQLTIPKFTTMIKTVLGKGIKVIDYSPENIQVAREFSDKEIGLLPYQYEQNEIHKLKSFIEIAPKKYDIVFVGWVSQRRKNIIVELTRRGFSVHIMQGDWGAQRDFSIAQAKLLLNIHFDDTYNVYEAIRCDRWLFSGLMVVSEDSINIDLLDTKDLVYFEKYDGLVDKVTEILKNYDKYHDEFTEKYNRTIDELKKKRSMSQEEFNNIISF